MGLDFHLECLECEDSSSEIEFSAVPRYRVKSLPDGHEALEREWIPFLVQHSSHRIALVDAFGAQTDPKKVTGGYILRITDYEG